MNGLVFQQLFEQSPNAYMVLDRELRYVAANAAGRVHVDASRYAGGHRFEVRDDGPGVAADQRDKIWELFRTGRANTSGTGIGLSIVKRTVEAHGGVVEVSATPGGGATFSFTWPDAAAR